MGIEKTKWRDLGLTPRQLSKKMGVTCSMAEFIAQSYRVPLQIKGPQVACARSPRRQKPPKKNPCTENTAPRRCEDAPTPAAPLPVPGSRKRRRSGEELSDCGDSSASCAWTKTKEVYECRDSSCSALPSHTSNKHHHCGKGSTLTCYSSPSRRKRCKVTRCPKARCLQRRRNPKSQRKKATRAKRRQTGDGQAKQQLIPINLRLDIPLNIILDEKDGVQLEGDGQLCLKCKCPTAQEPPPLQECSPAPRSGRGPEAHSAQPPEEEEEGACLEEAQLEECMPCEEDCSSEEKDGCGPKAKAKESGPTSWWEKIQECMVFFESLLSSLINKC